MQQLKFYSIYILYFLLWALMLCGPTLSFYIEKDGINREYTLDGWLESSYNVFIGMGLFFGLALAGLNYYFGG